MPVDRPRRVVKWQNDSGQNNVLTAEIAEPESFCHSIILPLHLAKADAGSDATRDRQRPLVANAVRRRHSDNAGRLLSDRDAGGFFGAADIDTSVAVGRCGPALAAEHVGAGQFVVRIRRRRGDDDFT